MNGKTASPVVPCPMRKFCSHCYFFGIVLAYSRTSLSWAVLALNVNLYAMFVANYRPMTARVGCLSFEKVCALSCVLVIGIV